MLQIERTRPLGITIIAIITAVFGILNLIGGLMLMSSSVTLGIIGVVLGILELALTWGLWTLKSWAFWATVIIQVLALLNAVFALTQGSTTSGVINIVIPVVILIYLFADRNVRLAFRT